MSYFFYSISGNSVLPKSLDTVKGNKEKRVIIGGPLPNKVFFLRWKWTVINLIGFQNNVTLNVKWSLLHLKTSVTDKLICNSSVCDHFLHGRFLSVRILSSPNGRSPSSQKHCQDCSHITFFGTKCTHPHPHRWSFSITVWPAALPPLSQQSKARLLNWSK